MKFEPNIPPRRYATGNLNVVSIEDIGRLQLSPDEQVTIVDEFGSELDVTRKDWGFYATPSLNGRLSTFGFRSALVRNNLGRYFVLLINRNKQREFEKYMSEQDLTLTLWLDDGNELDKKFSEVGES
tara:strand:+ start:455 stop:835 length:381 start_codon:yes stop_codon:yes gene_type:complete